MRIVRRSLVLALAVLTVAGCSLFSGDKEDRNALRVLAGSELADLQPILDDLQRATGVKVKLSFTGTLDGVEQVYSGRAAASHDATWFSSNRYLQLHGGVDRQIGTQTKIMSSPVVLGLRAPVARSLGWDSKRPTWREVADAALARTFSYGMTNPSASNSGFSALVALASALAGSGAALTEAQVTQVSVQLEEFFGAQALTAGSSGWLADAFERKVREGDPIGGLINYESVLLSLNARGTLPEPLTIVYPTDGVVTADYPLTLLSNASAEARGRYDTAVEYLRRPEVQRQIMDQTHRRPVVPQVAADGRFAGGTLVELPFPVKLEVADALIHAFNEVARRPPATIYVLDLSGSMRGERIDALKTAMLGLSGADSSLAGRFSRFHGREQVTLVTFSSRVAEPLVFTVPPIDPQPVFEQIRSVVQAWQVGGDTALYDALAVAYELAGQQVRDTPERVTTIVLLSDGEQTAGRDLGQFRDFYRGLSAATRGVPVFPVLFGESAEGEMAEVAQLTGGRTFDGRSDSLATAFKEIRGYQ